MIGGALTGALPRREQPRSGGQSLAVLLGLLVLCLAVGGLGGAITATSLDSWYQDLNKPVITPPDWVFGVVWPTLFVLIAVAAWLAWRRAASGAIAFAGGAFAMQLVLNTGWTGLFFGARSPMWAFFEALLLLVAIRINQLAFASLDRRAGWLMLPYLLWVTYACVLTAMVWRLNG